MGVPGLELVLTRLLHSGFMIWQESLAGVLCKVRTEQIDHPKLDDRAYNGVIRKFFTATTATNHCIC